MTGRTLLTLMGLMGSLTIVSHFFVWTVEQECVISRSVVLFVPVMKIFDSGLNG